MRPSALCRQTGRRHRHGRQDGSKLNSPHSAQGGSGPASDRGTQSPEPSACGKVATSNDLLPPHRQRCSSGRKLWGGAIRFPNPPLGIVSWLGKRRGDNHNSGKSEPFSDGSDQFLDARYEWAELGQTPASGSHAVPQCPCTSAVSPPRDPVPVQEGGESRGR
jgi:hypothetical protein